MLSWLGRISWSVWPQIPGGQLIVDGGLGGSSDGGRVWAGPRKARYSERRGETCSEVTSPDVDDGVTTDVTKFMPGGVPASTVSFLEPPGGSLVRS